MRRSCLFICSRSRPHSAHSAGSGENRTGLRKPRGCHRRTTPRRPLQEVRNRRDQMPGKSRPCGLPDCKHESREMRQHVCNLESITYQWRVKQDKQCERRRESFHRNETKRIRSLAASPVPHTMAIPTPGVQAQRTARRRIRPECRAPAPRTKQRQSSVAVTGAPPAHQQATRPDSERLPWVRRARRWTETAPAAAWPAAHAMKARSDCESCEPAPLFLYAVTSD
jgi:hypothetical protein